MRPLGCLPLRPGLKALSFIQIAVSGFILFASIASLIYYEYHNEEAVQFLNDPPMIVDIFMNMRDVRPSAIRACLYYSIFHYFQALVMGLILLVAVIKNNKFLIRLNVLYMLALIVLHCLIYLTLLCFTMMCVWSIIPYVIGFIFQEWVMWASTKYLDDLVLGTNSDEDDHYDFASRRSSGNDEKYSYKL